LELLILRHGDAEAGSPDCYRQLSAYGRDQVHRQALKHQRDAAAIELVVSSPYTRAAQTAEIFSKTINHNRIDWLDDLTPQGDLRAIEEFLQQTEAQHVLLVGHLPLLGLLIDYLTGDKGASMGTGNLASLSMDYPAQGLATLNWNHHVD